MKNKLYFILTLLAVIGMNLPANAASVKNAKSGAGATGKVEAVEVTYDYSKDGGATGALTLFTANQDLVIHRVVAKVKTAVTGTYSALGVGISGGSSVAFLSQNYENLLTTGAVIDSKLGGVKLASGGVMIQTISVSAFTAGKVTYLIEYSKF